MNNDNQTGVVDQQKMDSGSSVDVSDTPDVPDDEDSDNIESGM